jgi:hypothetical protein
MNEAAPHDESLTAMPVSLSPSPSPACGRGERREPLRVFHVKGIMARLIPLLLLVLLVCPPATAELVLITHPDSTTERLTRTDAIHIYMGRLRRFPDGSPAHPLDMPADSREKAEFYRLLLNKDLADIDSYWSRLVYSGNTRPPASVKSQEDMVERVAGRRDTLGYVERARVNRRVRILLELKP